MSYDIHVSCWMLNWTTYHADRTGPDPAHDRCRDGLSRADRTGPGCAHALRMLYHQTISAIQRRRETTYFHPEIDQAFLADALISMTVIVIIIITVICIQNRDVSPMKAVKTSKAKASHDDLCFIDSKKT